VYSTGSAASQFSSTAQACPTYFGRELFKTERKEERKLHTIVIQIKRLEAASAAVTMIW